VYDGPTTSANLLGKFAGNNIPPSITSTGGSMLVRFVSDMEVNKQGFTANYTSTQNSYCSGTTTTLTTPTGTFQDGSGANNYADNTQCSWLIQPANASSITLTFSDFKTELNNDRVVVYDGDNSAAPVLGQFSGASIPNAVTSTGGSMYVAFSSNPTVRAQGWTANYTSQTVGIDEADFIKQNLQIYPNPTDGLFTINSKFDETVTIQILDVLGKQVFKTHRLKKGVNTFNVSDWSKGVYLIKFSIGENPYTHRLIVN
jgi:hypothetical protein